MNVIRTYHAKDDRFFKRGIIARKWREFSCLAVVDTDQGGNGEVEREGNRWCPFG